MKSIRLRSARDASSSEGVRRISVAHFLIALVVLILATPFVEELAYSSQIEATMMTVVLLSAVLAVGGRRRTLLIAAGLAIPAILGIWTQHLHPHSGPRSLGLAAAIVFAVFVIVQLLAFILRAERVNSEVLCAAIANYLMLGVVWAMAYELLWELSPASFVLSESVDVSREIRGFEALYFSFGTLAPINDADITPRSNVARLLVMVEATVGMLYMGMLIARLVGIYSNEEAAADDDNSAEP